MTFDELTASQQRDTIAQMTEGANFMLAQHSAAANAITDEEKTARLALAHQKRFEMFATFEALGLLAWYEAQKAGHA